MRESQFLEFDSSFFRIPTASIIPPTLDGSSLTRILETLRQQGARLVYWASSNIDIVSQQAAVSLGGYLADEKVTLSMKVGKMHSVAVHSKHAIEEYSDPVPTPELENLAIQSGEFSRFNVDPNFSRTQYENLYRLWIQKSTGKIMARCILVSKHENRITGMITLAEKEGRGSIGLMAVAAEARGRGIGLSLVKAGHAWFSEKQYQVLQVVTQKRNSSGLRLYKKCGYTVEKIENVYHFWL